jgi:hypothetical protein
MAWQVVGYEDDGTEVLEEVEGDVMGDVMGPPRRPTRGGVVRMTKPAWRRSQIAPGVIAPDQGLLTLPMNGSGGTNTFTAAIPSITFQGQLQKPFRGERLLVSVIRTGASSTGRLLGQIFVGTDLQQLDIAGVDIEQIGTPNAFGVRLTMKPAQPGVFIRIVTTLSSALAGTDTIFASVQLLGRNVH